jgi:hypothetical protein
MQGRKTIREPPEEGFEVDYPKEKVPVAGVVPIDKMTGDDEEDTKLLRVMASGAENYLRCFPWCKGIRASRVSRGRDR